MKYLFTTIFVIFSSISLGAGNHHGHDHSHGHGHSHAAREIKKERTGVIGRVQVERLVLEKKIDKSWMKSSFEKTVVKDGEWLVTFINKKGVKGQKLYIFLSKSGRFIAANFTGK